MLNFEKNMSKSSWTVNNNNEYYDCYYYHD